MSDVEAVCFDLDGTLCVPEQSDGDIHAAVFDRVEVEPYFQPADLRAIDAVDLPTADSDREFYATLYRAAARRVGAEPRRVEDLAAATVEVVDESAVTFRVGARETLEYVRDRYEVGLVTNGGAETQRAKLDALEIRDAFDVTVYCDPAAGVEPKPDPRAFELALADLAATRDRTLYVGDDHGRDVVGAHQAGLQSAWVPPDRPHGSVPDDPYPEPTYWLDSLVELSAVL